MPTRSVIAALLSLLAAATVTSAANKPAARGPNPKLAPVDAQLQALFQKADENSDGYLDADELAHVFRGSRAKAAPSPYDDKGNISSASRDTRKYPDLAFLEAVDKDSDGRVSWDEYRQYGEAAARALQAQAAQQQKALQQLMRTLRSAQARGMRANRYGNVNAQAQRAVQAQQHAMQAQVAQQQRAMQAQERAMQAQMAQARRMAEEAQRRMFEAGRRRR